PALPALACLRAKCIHLPQHALTFECADWGLVRDREKNAHRPVGRGEGLFLFEGVAFGERFERGRDQAQRIERELEFRSRRTRFDLLMKSTQTLAHFAGCKIDIVSSKAAGSRFKSSGTAIDCKS